MQKFLLLTPLNLSNIRKFFNKDLPDNLSTCEINGCGAALRDNHATNFERHMEGRHEECYKTYCREKSTPSKLKKVYKDCDVSSLSWIVPRPASHYNDFGSRTIQNNSCKNGLISFGKCLLRTGCS